MTRLSIAILCSLVLSSTPYRPPDPAPPLAISILHERPDIRANSNRLPAVYTNAAIATSNRPDLLYAIAYAETTNGTDLAHRNPLDAGWFGLHERQDIRAERVGKWGWYNPNDPMQAARIAGLILAEHRANLSRRYPDKAPDEIEALTITAYHKGLDWTCRHGVYSPYVGRVEEGKALARDERRKTK